MNHIKPYRDSLLSALCIISWFVIVFRIFSAAANEQLIMKFVRTWMVTISAGIIGGIALHFYCGLKKRKLNQHFVYNLFATLNILVGSAGMTLPSAAGRPAPYLIAASLAVGIMMYKNIYGGIKWTSVK